MRDINALHPRLQEKVYQLIDLCQQNGITIGISECYRTVAEQDALYAKGRTAAGSIVTNCKGTAYKSMHQWYIAFDFYLIMDVDGDGKTNDDSFNDSTGLFEKVGALGQSIGLEWGGSWKSIKDKPHFQLPDWGSTPTKLIQQYGTPEKFKASWDTSSSASTPAPTPSTPATTAPSVNGSATCTSKNGLNMRAGIGTGTSKVTAIPYKKTCAVIQLNAGTANGYTWAKVSYGGKTGYVAQKYLNVTKYPSQSTTTTNSATSQTSSGSYSKSTVEGATGFSKTYAATYKTTSALRLRSGAGTNKNIITVIPSGGTVSCYGYYSSVSGTPWYLVAYGKYTGYVSSKYLKKK